MDGATGTGSQGGPSRCFRRNASVRRLSFFLGWHQNMTCRDGLGMVTYRWRRTLVMAIILMSLGRAEAVAQSNDRVEVSVGMGALAAGGVS